MNIRILPTPQALPTPETICGDGYTCPSCGVPYHTDRANKGSEAAVDTGIAIDFDGTLILCETCVRLLGEAVGLIDPEQGKARASDVRRSQRREQAIRAAESKRLAAVQACAEAVQALEDMERELSD